MITIAQGLEDLWTAVQKLFTYWSNDFVISCHVIQPVAQRCKIHYKTRRKTQTTKKNA